ncbi:penicillin-binding protein activator [Granulosicoccus antarcticus]|uniref:Penicillin-binding protein activator LpoA n=1 Tax=Granulosicoccus antarcticus IMCC3135 TaxID=1192854 RepID=A0A2Z2NX26_9GAMM|nr:penicillin-binding protein activator [Granulosicoccus antarcticus]ASJ75899.1 Penicillin-binding protein activator LpoA [Granulosicoccus antarcticus IMCC3135]
MIELTRLRHPKRRRVRLRLVLLLSSVIASTLAGCVTPSAAPLSDNPMNARITDPAARRQLQLGNPVAAADIYSERAARSNDPAQQQDYLILAAEILFDRNMGIDGQARMARVPEKLANTELTHRRDIVLAKSHIFDRDAEAALAALPNPKYVENAFHRARLYETRAQAYKILKDPDNELIARIELENQVNDKGIIQRGHEQIWQLLTNQSQSTLRGMTTNVRGDVYQGWIELALAHANAGADPAKQRSSISLWQDRFPTHPANAEFISALYTPVGFEMNVDGKPINQIAVLLPLSASSTSTVAAAIRDGIMAAYEQAGDRGQTPVLRLYDVGDNPGYVRNAYANAISDGANAVIGPLRKEAVAAIVSQREVPVPTITLNTVESAGLGGNTSNIIQFGLAPEDEARAAASRAAGLGLKNAIVLQSEDSRGDRETQAFRDAMFQYGGDVVHVAILPSDTYDYSAQIREALSIDKSDARFRTLSSTIGEKLFFEPSIRNDVDVVFLAITSEQARSVRPQLDFFHARDLPRLGTSRVASLDDDEKNNKDLNSIFYPDAPWVLRESMQDDPLRQSILANFPSANGAYAKLYALGADAYQLVTNLDALTRGERLQGYTGELELGSDGRIRRYLDWAQYIEGVSTPVESVDAPALPSIQSNGIN